MRAKSFFYVSLGILALALAYHLGATSASAQAPGNPVAAIGTFGFGEAVVTANGDVYASANSGDPGAPWSKTANIFGNPTPAAQPSFGQLKAQYRK